MWPRIIGTETEYGLLAIKDGRPFEPLRLPVKMREFLEECIPHDLCPKYFLFPTGNAYLSNGARFYIDTGQHPEYACPEGCGPHEAALNELAGGRIVEGTVANANTLWEKEGIKMRCFKNNLPSDASYLESVPPVWDSFGNHENYLVSRSVVEVGESIPVKIGAILYPYFASGYIFSGNGWVVRSQDKIVYLLSQRALTIQGLAGGATTSHRPIISTRDEPHADKNKYTRLHIICRDSLMLQPALLWKLGTLDILLDAIEEGFLRECPLGNWEKKDVLNAIGVFVRDPQLESVVSVDGFYNNAASIQKCFRDIAWKFCEASGHIDEKRKQILKLWDTFIECAESPNPLEALSPYVDGAAKRVFMEKDMEKRGYGWDSHASDVVRVPGKKDCTLFYHLKELDLRFSEECSQGIARNFIRRGIFESIFTEEEIQAAIFMPAPTTRGYARALKWRRFREFALKNKCRLKFKVDWTYETVEIEGGEKIYDNSSDENKALDPFDIDSHLPKNL